MMTKPLSVNDLPIVFADVTPIPQDDGPHAETAAICRIDYKPDFIAAYDLFRAILRADERSDRALQLTELCLQLNPANYTVWHFRRVCWLEHSERLFPGPGLDYDLALAAKLGGDNPKNYQIWYHRRALLELIPTLVAGATEQKSPAAVMQAYYQKELDYIQTVIQADSKNYHAWSHRQWVVQQLSQAHIVQSSSQNDDVIWIQEQGYTDVLIQMDPRNNSAWNHRWFVVHRGKQQGIEQREQPALLDLDTAKQEAEYALQGARLDPFNESPWRYLIAILKEQLPGMDQEMQRELLSEYEEKAWSVQDVLKDFSGTTTAATTSDDYDSACCPNLMSAVIDILECKGDKDSLEKVYAMTNVMAEQHDTIRRKYWNLRCRQAEDELAKLTMTTTTTTTSS